MSGHHKNKGFSQKSKRYDGDLKAQHQRSRSKQMDHSADHREEEVESREPQKNSSQKNHHDHKRGLHENESVAGQ